MIMFRAFILLFFLSSSLAAAERPLISPRFSPNGKDIVLKNRILTKVNGKAISALDVMKRMDVLFYQLFPKFADSVKSRFQFYQTNWKHILEEMIDRELILTDATEKKVSASDGEIREEMEELYGPSVIENIDKLGMTYEEVWQMIHTDITVKRMLLIRVHGKAMNSTTPKEILTAYKQFAAEFDNSSLWNYQVVTIKDDDLELAEEISNLAYDLLQDGIASLENLEEKILEKSTRISLPKITLSEDYQHTEKSISPMHEEVVAAMEPKSYSNPIKQLSRSTGKTTYRIFHLKEFVKKQTPSYNEVEDQLKNHLYELTKAREAKKYLQNLRKLYGIDTNDHSQETALADFEPFSLN
ncbi:MAG: hypothetical protein ACI9S8_001873 [Chlamydiales bacterium]|jgi:hypothetical protein